MARRLSATTDGKAELLSLIRVLLSRMWPTQRNMVERSISNQPDMLVVGVVDNGLELLLAVREARADAVVLGQDDSETPGFCDHLLSEYPHLKILTISRDCRQAILFDVKPEKTPLHDTSLEAILNTLRLAVTHHAPFM